MGLLSVSGRYRSARRYQLALAFVRHLKSAAERDCAVRRDNCASEDAWNALYVGHYTASGLAGHGDVYCWL